MTQELTSPMVLTRQQVRDVDRIAIDQYGMPGVALMENAGRNTAALLRSLGINGRVAICCGKGNNAGDGFVIARHLENAGVDVRVLLCSTTETLDPAAGRRDARLSRVQNSHTVRAMSDDAAINYRIIERAGTGIIGPPVDWQQELADTDWIVDALLGTGTQGTIREPFVSAVNAINQSGRKVLAVDLPSGMDCNTGQPLGCCIRANATATFVARKPGFDQPGAAGWTGDVHVIDIGVPRALLRELVSRQAQSVDQPL